MVGVKGENSRGLMHNLIISSKQRVAWKRGQFLCSFRKQNCRKRVGVTKLVKERLLILKSCQPLE